MKIANRLIILLLFLIPTLLIGVYAFYTIGWIVCAILTLIKSTPILLCKIHPINFDSGCLHFIMLVFIPVFIECYKSACSCLNRNLASIVDYLLTNLPMMVMLIILLIGFRFGYNNICFVAGFLIKCMIAAPFIGIIFRNLKGG